MPSIAAVRAPRPAAAPSAPPAVAASRADSWAAPWIAPWIAATAILALALFSPGVLNDGDTFWHVKAGEWIIAHGAVPHVDVFSHTRAGADWVAHEWLAEAAMALAFRAAGWSGVLVLTAAAAAAAFFGLARHLGRWLPAGPVLLLALGAAALTAPGLLARPHILALPLFEAWVAGLFIARAAGRAPSWGLLPVMCVWANLHGGYMFGLALVCPLALEALLAAPQDWRATTLRWGGFGLAGTAVATLTPHGLAGLLFPFQLAGMAELSFIKEWAPADFGTLQALELLLLAGLYAALSRGARLPPLRLLLLLGLLHMSLRHGRHEALIAIVVPLLLAGTLAATLPPRRTAHGGDPRWGTAGAGLALAGPALAGLVPAVLVALRLLLPAAPGGNAPLPIAALAHVPAELAAQPVFNDYAFGGYLIHAGLRPYIDGRADMYGPAVLREYAAITSPNKAALDRAFAQYGIRWTLLPPGSPAVQLLDLMPHWCRLYSDEVAVVHAASC